MDRVFPREFAWMDVGLDRFYEDSLDAIKGPVFATESAFAIASTDTKYSTPGPSTASQPANTPHYKCLRGNIHFGRGEFGAAVDLYTEALGQLSAAGVLDSSATDSKGAHADSGDAALAAMCFANRSAASFAMSRRSDLKQAVADGAAAAAAFPAWPRGLYRKAIAEKGLGMYLSAAKTLAEGMAVAVAETERVTEGPERKFFSRIPSMVPEFQAAREELEKTIAYEGESDADVSGEEAVVDEGDKFYQLESWLLSRKSSSFPLIFMRKYSENNRGVHARTDIAPDAQVMAIGREFLITVEMGKASFLGRKLSISGIDRELSASKHCYLALFVLHDRKNPDSFFQPYYKILPTSYPNMPIFWSEEELSYLHGSYVLQQVADRKENLRLDYEAICKVVPEVSQLCTFEEFAWARMMVASRNFGILVDNNRTDALVPYADMLNHYRPRQTRWAFDSRKQSFLIHSMTKLYAGQQVYDSYGKKCNSRFLLNYGFTVDYNKDDDTGQSHNEVRLLMSLLPPEEDPWYSQKIKLLGHAAARDDWQVGYAHPALRNVRSVAPIDTVRSVRVSTYYENEGTIEAFSFLRFANAKDYETIYLPKIEGDFDFVRRPLAPISVDNELRCLRSLAALMREQLSKYATTLEDDVAELRSGRWPYGSNKRNALVLLKGEKEVCYYYINLYEVCEALAALPAAEIEPAIMMHMGDNDIDKYVRTIFARVLRKRAEEAAMDAGGHRSASTTDDIGTHLSALSELSLRYNPR